MSRLFRQLGKRVALRTPGLRAVVNERDELRCRVGRMAQQGPVSSVAPQPPPEGPERDQWFWDHYSWAVEQMKAFLGGGGVSLAGRHVGDVGCGDGIIDLGVAHRLEPARLVGFDIVPTKVDELLRRAVSQGVPGERLPACLEFRVSGPVRLPAEDASFDVVISWSAFEHIGDPLALLREIRRVLRPGGVLYLQLWPFFHSQHGSHLQKWFPDGFVHLLREPAEIEAGVRAGDEAYPGEREYMLSEFSKLNRITIDDLHRCLLIAGFAITRAELYAQPFPVPPGLARYSLAQLGISGVQLIAVLAEGGSPPAGT
jgi:SAM-dependent methyltransferase